MSGSVSPANQASCNQAGGAYQARSSLRWWPGTARQAVVWRSEGKRCPCLRGQVTRAELLCQRLALRGSLAGNAISRRACAGRWGCCRRGAGRGSTRWDRGSPGVLEIHVPLESLHCLLPPLLLSVTHALLAPLHLGSVLLLILSAGGVDCSEKVFHPIARGSAHPAAADARVELVEDQAHAPREVLDIRLATAALAGLLQGVLEALKVRHPLRGKVVRNDVGLVEADHDRQLGLVHDAAGVKHVGHEGDRVGRARRVNHVGKHRGHGGGERLGDNCAGGRPSEHLDLARRVHHDVLEVAEALLHQAHDLVELRGE
mmetsp:Transcript_2096/g.5385  ORF Transcript_2096/g.5385 Transcript_2096/m.5385 type:complete len:316 (-) Transcript_2096:151-1098(-)